MPQDKIRIGFIGAGQNTQLMHIPKLQSIPGVEMKEVANRTLASGERIVEGFNIKRARSGWQEIVTSDDIDAIVIGTWPYLHCEASCAALKNGKHVLCEARMAMNLTEAQEMQKASKAHPHLITQLVPAPFTLHLDKTIHSYIAQGRLGRLLYFHVDYQSTLKSGSNETLHWRRNKKYSGENTMALGIIYESILRWIPPAKIISAVGKIFTNKALDPELKQVVNIEIPDYLSVQMEMENGIRGSFNISEVSLHAPIPTIQIHGTHGSMKIEFIPNGKLWYGSKTDTVLQEVKIESQDNSYWRVEEEFINAIRGKENVSMTTFDSGVNYMRFTQAVMDSYREHGNLKYV